MKETATLEFRSEIGQAMSGIDRLEGKVDALGKQQDSLGDRAAASTGRWLRNVLGLATAYVSLRAAVGFVSSSLRAHQDLEQAMLGYAAATGTSRDEVDALRADVLRLANDSGVAMADAFRGLKEVTGAGFAPDAGGLEVLKEALNLAKLGALDLDTAVGIVTRTLLAYNLTATEAGEVSGLLFEATRAGNLQADEVARSFQLLAPEARALGLELSDVATALAELTNAGRTGKQATTELGQLFGALLSPSKDLAEAVDELGLKMLNADVLRDQGLLPVLRELQALPASDFDRIAAAVGSVDAALALRELVTNADSFAATMDTMAASSTAAADATEVLTSGFTGTMARMSATWTNTKALMGEGLAAILIGPLQTLLDGMDRFSVGLEKIKAKYQAVMAAGGTEAEASRAAWDEFVVQWQTTIMPALAAGWDLLKDKLAAMDWPGIFTDIIVGAFKLMLDVLQELWNGFWSNLPSIVGGVIQTVLGMVEGMLTGILEGIVGMIQSAFGLITNAGAEYPAWGNGDTGQQYGGAVGGYQYGGTVGAPDRVPARLAVGEHVMRREVATAPGMGDLLNALNTMGPAALNVNLPNVTDRSTALQVAPRLASGMMRFGGGAGLR